MENTEINFYIQLKGLLNLEQFKTAVASIASLFSEQKSLIISNDVGSSNSIEAKYEMASIEFSNCENPSEGARVWMQSQVDELPRWTTQQFSFKCTLMLICSDEHWLFIKCQNSSSTLHELVIWLNNLATAYKSLSEGVVVLPNSFHPKHKINRTENTDLMKYDFDIEYWGQKMSNRSGTRQKKNGQLGNDRGDRYRSYYLNIESKERLNVKTVMTVTKTDLLDLTIAALIIYYANISAQSQLIFGIPASNNRFGGRNPSDETIDFWPFKMDVNKGMELGDLLVEIKKSRKEDADHQNYPLHAVLDSVGVNHLDNLYDIVIDVAELNIELDFGEMIQQVIIPLRGGAKKYPLEVCWTDYHKNHQLQLGLHYDEAYFSIEQIELLASRLVFILDQFALAMNKNVSEIQTLATKEQRLLREFNLTYESYPDDKSIVDLFQNQVSLTPDRRALSFEEQHLTYAELNGRANHLAYELMSKGVREGSLVPICIERSLNMLVAILGVLKTGCAFVPIDPDYPQERINYMLEDCEASIIITSKYSRSKLSASPEFQIIELEGFNFFNKDSHIGNLQKAVKPNHLAYVIYTSGSTGRPKGVMIEHKSIVNLLFSMAKKVAFNESCIFLSVTTFSFDICYLEFFLPLLFGGKLVLVSRQVAMDGFILSKSLSHYRPTHMQGTPATWQLLFEAGWQNREQIKILVGGEALKEDLKDALLKVGESWNLYGPTETTIWSTSKKLVANEKVLIGAPLANTFIYILDEQKLLCPIGVTGEIYIAGAGLARGYLHRPELTAEKFVADPFSSIKEARMYKTGDLGHWLPDGNLEYLGRKDDQVKIRGYRIELGEIERVLQECEYVSQAAVVAKQDAQGNKSLVCYYMPEPSAIKLKERELYHLQVEGWKEVYETEYVKTEKDDEIDQEFNSVIWTNSFTGVPIDEVEMREAIDDVVNIILSQEPGVVLEIGCGTGMIFYQLVGKVSKYIGTDFSSSSINHITRTINRGLRDYGLVDLQVCAAHEVKLTTEDDIRTIVINSVIQHFPGQDYMNEVISNNISLLNGQGRIIIGDVRDYRLLNLFKTQVQLQKLDHSVTRDEFNWIVEQEIFKEDQLCLSPEYFYNLPNLFPEISYVSIQLKKGKYLNELSLYRYNVILYVGIESKRNEPEWKEWKNEIDFGGVLGMFDEGNQVIAIKNAPNSRLFNDKLLSIALNNKFLDTIGDIVNAATGEDKEIVEIRHILKVADERNYNCLIFPDDDPFKVNLLLEINPSFSFIPHVYKENGDQRKATLGNIPLFSDICTMWQKEIKDVLQRRLPDYMMPASIIPLGRLPLTANGKIDRKFLQLREDKVVINKSNYQPPSNEIETRLVTIWEELLNIEPIGINDNFFELGGHSLLAVRLISAIRNQLNVELPINELFNSPTIGALAIRIEAGNSLFLLPPIVLQPRPEHIPLSFSQERLWFIDQLEGSIQYHTPALWRIVGVLNGAALTFALQNILQRHEVLRTVIKEEEGQASQVVIEDRDWHIGLIDGGRFQQHPKDLQRYVEVLINAPFDLWKDFMLRADLIKIAENDHLLVITMHHIASDGWSLFTFEQELVELYEAYTQDRSARLVELPIQYADYAIWQRRYLTPEVLEKKVGYWRQKLNGVTPLQLPLDYPRPPIQSKRGATSDFHIDKELSDKLQALSHKHGVTLFMTLLAAFKVLLYRYSGQEDICVGTPMAGRQQHEVEGLIGFFVNTLTLRSEVTGNLSFSALLGSVKTTMLEAYEHQEVPFEKVVEAVVKERDLSRNPLFQVMFVFLNTPEAPQLRLGDLHLTTETFEQTTSLFDMTFFMGHESNGLTGSVEYSTDLYNKQTIERMMGHYEVLLYSIVGQPDQEVGVLPMLRQEEKEQLLEGFNDTEVSYPFDLTIVDLFEEQAARTPASLAVVFEGEQLSYRELDDRSNQLAHYLRDKGVREETLVAICIERSPEMIIGILGIIKAGGTYVPMDPSYPMERIRYMLEDTGARIVVSSKASRLKIPISQPVEIIELDGHWHLIKRELVTKADSKLESSYLTYILYTSGSTGFPKGVKMPTRSLTNLLIWQEKQFQNKRRQILQFASLNFDVSFQEIFSTLCFGSILYLIADERRKDMSELLKDLIECKITHLFIPYIFLKNLAEYAREAFLNSGTLCLEEINTAGEQLKLTEDIQSFLDKNMIRLINQYGPTEAHVVSSHIVSANYQVCPLPSIGKPISNTSIYILNERVELLPIGVIGEICIGGAGLARGYLNRPELTAEKFILNPFSKEKGSRLYKTGDLGRWLPDGNIEYVGRKDDQVKIRGYRIELGEIESVLQQSELVRQAVVMAREDNEGAKRLVCYVVGEEGYKKEAVTDYLRSQLPEYMVPQLWVELEILPFTSNGKIDRKALPDIDSSPLATARYVAPDTKLEKQLVDIWERLLGVEPVGIHDNFFELGGHSLLAVRLISTIGKELDVELSIRDLFVHPTIAGLSLYLQVQGIGLLLPALGGQFRPEQIPLSFGQERLWFIDRLEGSSQYNIPSVLRIRGELNRDALTDALHAIITRHEALRTVIRDEEGQPWQYVQDDQAWKLLLVDGSVYTNGNSLSGYIQELVDAPFDLSKDYMLRAALVSVNELDHLLVVTMHHIASDGWSLSIFEKEMLGLYNFYAYGHKAQLLPLTIQYADYAIWQRQYLTPEVLENKIAYWKRKLNGIIPLQLPLDYPRPPILSKRGATSDFRIDKELSDKLQALSHKHGVTLFMTLLAAFKVLLYRYSGQEDICVGTPMAGRQQQEIEGLIGFFVNTLALRSKVTGNLSFSALLDSVKTTMLEAYEHQEVPFEKVVEAVVRERDLSRNPLFQVMFVFLNTPEAPQLRLGDLHLTTETFEQTTSLFDMTFFMGHESNGLTGSVEYSTDLYNKQTIERMMGHYKVLLYSIINQPQLDISKLSILKMDERNFLINELNELTVIYPKFKTLVDLFEDQVTKTPDAVAVVSQNENLTYRKLNESANQLARLLRNKGIREDKTVAICIEPSLQLIIGVIGILKAGGVYVPIDMDFPSDRISFMLKDSRSKILLSSKDVQLNMAIVDPSVEVVMIDDELSKSQPIENIQTGLLPNHLAYIIYTSGSTGMPKGVMIEHRNLIDYVFGLNRTLEIDRCKSYALMSTIATDLGNTVVYSSLLLGGALHVFSKKELSDIDFLVGYFKVNRIDCLKIVPMHWKALRLGDELLLPLELLIFGGDTLQYESISSMALNGHRCKIVNHYGPTETTIGKLLHIVESNRSYSNTVPIGKPFSNTQVYILNEALELQPIGVPGQLFISGDGIARGYHNNAELTSSKFIHNPFSKTVATSLMYSTGDIVKYLSDGNIEYIGRIDNQVKIRGYRIELGEVESVLQTFKSIKQAVVLVRDDGDRGKRLVGYLVLSGDGLDQSSLADYLSQKLPKYMIPSAWIELENLPLTENGKVDRKALSNLSTEFANTEYQAPRNELEKELCLVWQDLLKVQRVGIFDNFFELGGDSIKTIQVVSKIKRLGYSIQVKDLFLYQTIESLSKSITQKSAESQYISIDNMSKQKSQNIISNNYVGSLIPAKIGGNKMPLYIVCGGGGTVFKFKQLIEMLDISQPVYVLQQPTDAKELAEFPVEIKDVAARYVAEIVAQNPDGPYALSGHCYGGVVVFEMAKQMEAMGKKVNLLAMFDTIIDEEIQVNQSWIKLLINRIVSKVQFETFLFSKHTKHAIQYKVVTFKNSIKKLLLLKNSGGVKGDFEIFGELGDMFRSACTRYEITPFNKDVIVFYAKDHYHFVDKSKNISYKKYHLDENIKSKWDDYVRSATYYEIQGEHSTMFEVGFGGRQLADLLQKHLNLANK